MVSEAYKQISKQASDRTWAGYWEYKRRRDFECKVENAHNQLMRDIEISYTEMLFSNRLVVSAKQNS